jgi:hypothetical protein
MHTISSSHEESFLREKEQATRQKMQEKQERYRLTCILFFLCGFITNEPGTKRSENYWYSTDIFMNALHDWTGAKEEIATGAKTALVVEK